MAFHRHHGRWIDGGNVSWRQVARRRAHTAALAVARRHTLRLRGQSVAARVDMRHNCITACASRRKATSAPPAKVASVPLLQMRLGNAT
jgi:hypothetical protein